MFSVNSTDLRVIEGGGFALISTLDCILSTERILGRKYMRETRISRTAAVFRVITPSPDIIALRHRMTSLPGVSHIHKTQVSQYAAVPSAFASSTIDRYVSNR